MNKNTLSYLAIALIGLISTSTATAGSAEDACVLYKEKPAIFLTCMNSERGLDNTDAIGVENPQGSNSKPSNLPFVPP